MVLALVLFVLLIVSLAGNATHLLERLVTLNFTHERSYGPKLDEVVLEDNDSRNKVAVVGVEGIITSQFDDGGFDMIELIKEQLKRADDDKHVKAVVLKVNSPGGEVLASDDIARAIADFQQSSGKPVVCSMGSLAASGGYYVSAPCRWIVANELTITGSIGVIMHGWNYRGLMDKLGLRPDVYKSGKYKDMLSGERSPDEIPPEERAMVDGLITETFQKFKSVVAEGRTLAHKENGNEGHTLATNWTEFADGRVLSGRQAMNIGLVDQLGDYDAAVDKAIELAGLEDQTANVIEYQPRHELADLFRMFGKTDARTLKIDLGVQFPKLQAGCLYFLSPTYIR
jgi:protease-4